MPYVVYKATEQLAPGHVLNATYTLSFNVVRADPSNETLKREQRALSGNKETLYYGNVTRWSVTMEPIPAQLVPYYEEFFRSTADGQSFVFDPYGTEARPLKAMTVDREDTGHAPQRVTQTGDPVYFDMIEFSFELNQRA